MIWILLKNFSLDTCVQNADEKRQLEAFLVDYHDVFADHCFDVGYDTELKFELTAEHPHPAYVQGPTAPIHLRDEFFIALALLHFLNFLTTLSLSKDSSPFFVHCKSSVKLRVLIDSRSVNHLKGHAFLDSSFTFSNVMDATNHLAERSLFCKLGFSQA